MLPRGSYSYGAALPGQLVQYKLISVCLLAGMAWNAELILFCVASMNLMDLVKKGSTVMCVSVCHGFAESFVVPKELLGLHMLGLHTEG